MIRFHVHVTTHDLPGSVATYSLVFGTPVVAKPDYAKWEPAELPIVFAVSTRKPVAGIDHLGLKADSADELHALRAALVARGLPHVEQAGAECCYARADKLWVTDPNGIPWELYAGAGSIEVFGDDGRPAADPACCTGDAARPALVALSPKQA